MKPGAWMALPLALMASAVSASELASLIDLPVEGTALVPASQYRDALSRAARTGSPVDIALGVAGPFEGARQLIVQTNEGVESPSASRVTVIRDGLLDDAVRTERWDIARANGDRQLEGQAGQQVVALLARRHDGRVHSAAMSLMRRA